MRNSRVLKTRELGVGVNKVGRSHEVSQRVTSVYFATRLPAIAVKRLSFASWNVIAPFLGLRRTEDEPWNVLRARPVSSASRETSRVSLSIAVTTPCALTAEAPSSAAKHALPRGQMVNTARTPVTKVILTAHRRISSLLTETVLNPCLLPYKHEVTATSPRQPSPLVFDSRIPPFVRLSWQISRLAPRGAVLVCHLPRRTGSLTHCADSTSTQGPRSPRAHSAAATRMEELRTPEEQGESQPWQRTRKPRPQRATGGTGSEPIGRWMGRSLCRWSRLLGKRPRREKLSRQDDAHDSAGSESREAAALRWMIRSGILLAHREERPRGPESSQRMCR